MKKPNAFILGAPRCGTTALYHYLQENENIFIPVYKEIHYFADDLKAIQKFKYKSIEDYFTFFEDADIEKHQILMEVGTLYLSSKISIQNIYNYDPDAKLIVSLRNPVDFCYSYYQLNSQLRREDQPTFYDAWKLMDNRKKGKDLPANRRVDQIVIYSELAKFGEQLEFLFSIFPKEQVKVIFLDDYSKDMRSVYLDILNFLDIPDDGRKEFPRINQNFEYKSKFSQFLMHPPKWLYIPIVSVLNFLDKNSAGKIGSLHESIRNKLTKPSDRNTLDTEVYNEVLEYFLEDIQKLELLTGRDLSSWQVYK